MKIILIAAVAENNVIGRDNQLPWDLPDDMRFFMKTTKGHPVISGRKNFESIGKVLSKRSNIIITRRLDYSMEGCDVVHSLKEATFLAKTKPGSEKTYIIGGGEIYHQAMSIADRILLTRVHAKIEGDVTFPEINESTWDLVDKKHHPMDDRHAYSFTFLTYDRR